MEWNIPLISGQILFFHVSRNTTAMTTTLTRKKNLDDVVQMNLDYMDKKKLHLQLVTVFEKAPMKDKLKANFVALI